MRRHPLPSTGSLGLVPPLQRYYEVLRLPPPISPRFVSFAWRYHRCIRVFVPPGPGRGAVGHLELVGGISSRLGSMETAGSPKFLEEPL